MREWEEKYKMADLCDLFYTHFHRAKLFLFFCSLCCCCCCCSCRKWKSYSGKIYAFKSKFIATCMGGRLNEKKHLRKKILFETFLLSKFLFMQFFCVEKIFHLFIQFALDMNGEFYVLIDSLLLIEEKLIEWENFWLD